MLNSDSMKGTILLISLLSFIASSCVERINIELDNSYERLIVDGAITTDTMAQTVRLLKTTSYFYNQPAPPVTGAEVRISDGEAVYNLGEVSPGIYSTDPSVFGEAGKTYTLDIKLAAPVGGYSDYTAVSTLYPVTHLDSISLTFHSDWSDSGIWEVKCYVQDPTTKDYYRFLVSKNGKMLSDTLDEWFVTDDRFFNGNYVYGGPIAYLQRDKIDEALKVGDTVTVEMNSIGPEYYNFISEAQSEIRGSDPLFSGPPANVKGNLDNGAVGFFATYSISRAYTIVTDSP
jgi:Domain of unknown function (DUF4249)